MPSKRKITAKKPLFGNLRSHSMRATNASQMCSTSVSLSPNWNSMFR